MADRSQQTEKASPRRLQKARKEGQFATSRYFVGGVQFLVVVWLLTGGAGAWIQDLAQVFHQVVDRAFAPDLQAAELPELSAGLIRRAFIPLLIAGGAVVITTLASQFAVTRLGFSLKKLGPDLQRLNPISKLRQMPSQNLTAVAQAAVLLPAFAWIIYVIVKQHLMAFLALPLVSVPSAARVVADSVRELLWKASLAFAVIGVIDLFRERRRYDQGLRMSKQELKDEMKEMEGNPLMKMRIRRIRRDVLRRRMMQSVPTATAVIVNPTHYAVAIRYSMESGGAPTVVAKGKNYLALRIRKKAVECQIPLIENPPLAQALYAAAEVGQEIPAQFYRAVAEVLAYIYRVLNGRLRGQ